MIAVQLHEAESGRDLGRVPLPPHTSRRLVSGAHANGVASGALPNDGAPLESVLVELEPAAQVVCVELVGGGRSYTRRYSRLSLADDVEVIAARVAPLPRNNEDGDVAALERRVVFELVEARAEIAPASGLQVEPAPHALPVLERVSLRRAGLEQLPRCPHLAVFLPSVEAARLLAHARRTPDVEVAAILLAEPFLIEESVPEPLAVRVIDAVPLRDGAEGGATAIRISPAALASVPVDPAHGRYRGGLAHSHPLEAGLPDQLPFFLSSDDKAFATGFFWLPFQSQLIVDPRGLEPAASIAAFCWVDARLVRVCFHVTDLDFRQGVAR